LSSFSHHHYCQSYQGRYIEWRRCQGETVPIEKSPLSLFGCHISYGSQALDAISIVLVSAIAMIPELIPEGLAATVMLAYAHAMSTMERQKMPLSKCSLLVRLYKDHLGAATDWNELDLHADTVVPNQQS
jgi:magnesium-transporting ATPase (P-type)